MNTDWANTWIFWLTAYGGAWWILGALALSTFVSDDIACLVGGVLVGMQQVDFLPTAFACFAGIVAGDMLLVALGRKLGRGALERRPFRGRVSVAALERAERWFARHGGLALLLSRFLPGTRLPLYVAAGVLRVPVSTLFLSFSLSALVWAPLLVALGAWAGAKVEDLGNTVSQLSVWFAAAFALAWFFLRLVAALRSRRERRLLLSRWRRLTRWEYWPAWAVYPPVALWLLLLGLRHRSLMVCTAANPGIGAAGGLCGESKSEILRGLAPAGKRVAAWIALEPGEIGDRARQIASFQALLPVAWPIVLKPDVGERGSGVVIARTQDDVRSKLAEEPRRLIAQAYVPGVEFGVFYVRHPEGSGRVFAITEKRTVQVRGDGRRTLEMLILDDDRAVGMAHFFLEKFSARLSEVPAEGETVLLAELGTHCRGALFLDGHARLTPTLVRAVDEVSRAFAGFHYGRYDVRTPSAEAFERGEFTVIELNGLTSEATHIYDPAHSVWFGWRILFRQWSLAYAIGAANRARGARVWTIPEVWRLVRSRP